MSISESLVNDEDLFGDEDFDELLATIPLPGLAPSNKSNQSQPNKRKVDGLNQIEAAYEPLGFGEIGKYMANKRRKLQVQQSALRQTDTQSQTRPQIFAGLVIHVNGYTNPPISEIRDLIVLHGGIYVAYLDHKSILTHIIATSLTPKKRQEFRAYKLVTPEWIVKSVAARRLLNWQDFRLSIEITSKQHMIAKGEVTGGQVVSQRTLFGLANQRLARVRKTSQKKMETLPLSTPTVPSSPAAKSTDSQSSNHTIKLDQSHSFRLGKVKSLPRLSFNNPVPLHSPRQRSSSPSVSLASHQPRSTHDISDSLVRMEPIVTKLHQNSLKQLSGSPPRMCADPDFIQGYFQQSRLHHLSMWKAQLLQKISNLSENQRHPTKALTSSKKLKGDESDKRLIMHVDFDSFFISAGIINRPELKGKPLAVCHAQVNQSSKQTSSTSEIASCSYAARAFGVRNGQMLGHARKLCPELLTIPYDFKLYEDISFKFYQILLSYADELQAVSVDECLIDVSSQFLDLFLQPETLKEAVKELAEKIRRDIFQKTLCEASIGISHNILLAKLATKKAKPAGSYYLRGEQCQALLKDLQIDNLPGFGWAHKRELEQKLHVTKVADLMRLPISKLIETLGPSRGKTLYQYAHGIDDSPLKSIHHDRKSVSAVVNYGIRFKTASQGGHKEAENFIRQLGVEVGRRLTDLGMCGRHLTLKIMKRAANAPLESKKFMGHGICEELSKTVKLMGVPEAKINDGTVVGEEAWKQLKLMKIPPEELRGIGIQIQRLEKLGAGANLTKDKNQSTLMFPNAKASDLAAQKPKPAQLAPHQACDKSILKNPTDVKQVSIHSVATTSKHTLDPPESPTLFIVPPASQLDIEVIEALPTPYKSKILQSVSTTPESRATKAEGAPTRPHVSKNYITPLRRMQSARRSNCLSPLPPASQIDWNILSELPPSVRKPIEAIYGKRRQRRHHNPQPSAIGRRSSASVPDSTPHKSGELKNSSQKSPLVRFPIFKKERRGSRKKSVLNHRVPLIGPSQRLISKKSFKLITRKRIQSQSQEGKEPLPTPDRISDDQLQALEIDVKFFRELRGARAFQLDLIHDQYQLHSQKFNEITTKTDRWKTWRKNFGKPSKVLEIEIPGPPKIGYRSNNSKGISQFEEVIKLIEDWIQSYNGYDEDEIEQEDIYKIENFLIDSIDKKRGHGQDLEKVFKVLIFWEDLINSESKASRIRWEKVLKRIKLKINEVCIRDHGVEIY
ncbi:hypothetical protein O181_000327 [Austropuccinia psidii MF-1]|uniref:DNA repair protein REV1 n=1 Tax=Austropuccinia psidii MF-1 TaxID=1389203 RepID=A0A9Q3B8H7_9BASI|nr:hypothetical protein [Austropuccinia psidii MF-1]